MVMNKKNVAKATAATFGAALSSMYLAPELQADVLDLTWNGGNASAVHAFSSGTFNPGIINIDQVVDGTNTATDILQYNDLFGGVGRTMFVAGSRAIASITVMSFGQAVNFGTFGGAGSLGAATTFDGSGYRYVGFRDNGGNVGWYRVDFTTNGDFIFSGGEYGSMGENLVVGGATIPEPATAALGLLALGAVGLRRRRKAA